MSGLYWRPHWLAKEPYVKREKQRRTALGGGDGVDVVVRADQEEHYCFKSSMVGKVEGAGNLPNRNYFYGMEGDEYGDIVRGRSRSSRHRLAKRKDPYIGT